jgi:hypothetical protein
MLSGNIIDDLGEIKGVALWLTGSALSLASLAIRLASGAVQILKTRKVLRPQ